MKRRFFRGKFYGRMFCILLLAALIPSYATALYFYQDYAANIVERASGNNKRMLEYVGGSLDKIAEEMRRTAYDSPLRREITWFASNEFFVDPVAFEKLRKNLYLLVENTAYIDSVYLYFESYDYLLESHTRAGTSYVRLEKLADSGWLEDYNDGLFHHLYIRPAPGEEQGYITLLCPMLDAASRRQGAVVVNVRTEQVSHIIGSLRSEYSGNIYIVDSEGAVLMEDAAYPGLLLPEILPVEDGLIGAGRERLAVSATDSGQTGWTICSITPYKMMVGNFSFVSFARIALLMVLAMSVILALFSSRFLYTPLQRLLGRIGSDMEDDDEFRLIDRVYHSMAETAENLESKAMRGETAILEKALRRGVLYHEPAPPVLQETLVKLGVGQEGVRLFLAMLSPDLNGTQEDMPPTSDSWGIVFILQLAKELLEEHGIPGLVFETGDGVVVAAALRQSPENLRGGILETYLCELREMVARFLPFTVSIGVGGGITGWEQAGTAYIQAQAALSYRISRGCNQIFLYQSESDGRSVLLSLSTYSMRMEAMLRLRNRQEIVCCLDQLTEEISSQPDLTPNQVINAYLYLLFYAFHTLSALDQGAYHTLLRDTDVGELIGCGTQMACYQWMLDFFDRCFAALGTPETRPSSLSRKIRSAEAYIRAHYQEDIALTTVAEQIDLNATYFSKMFKEETGKSFLQYLQTIRMEKSKELLRTTGDTLSSIAVNVGMNSEKSFIRLFKKLNGCTPGQYRNSAAPDGDRFDHID